MPVVRSKAFLLKICEDHLRRACLHGMLLRAADTAMTSLSVTCSIQRKR